MSSATKDRLLLDQRGVNGHEVKLLEKPSVRLPARWPFTDLQLGSNECFRVSASDLSAFYDCWESRLKELLELGRLVTGEASKDLL